MILLSLWYHHRPALQADWIRIWQSTLDLKTTPLYAAWPMFKECVRDQARSHCYSVLAEDTYIPRDIELIGTSKTMTPAWKKPTIFDSAPVPRRMPVDNRRRSELNRMLGITE